MSHSYDNTLLQRMGFSDPDRRTPAHDDACIEIATDPERFIRAVREFRFLRKGSCELEVPLQKGDGKYASTVGFIDVMLTYETGSEDYSINHPMHLCSKGFRYKECQDARTIRSEHYEKMRNSGLDAVAYIRSNIVPSWVQSQMLHDAPDQHAQCEGPAPISGPAALSWSSRVALVEVKTRIDNLGFLLRQMNLYREYKKSHRTSHDIISISDFIIWSLDPADTRYAKLLSQQGYHLIAGPLPS